MTISDQPINTVLFDLSGTLIDESYIRAGLGAITTEARQRWGVDPADFIAAFHPTFAATSAQYATRPYYLMRDHICETLHRTLAQLGVDPTGELVDELEALLWATAVPAASCPEGTFDTLAALRQTGITTGIVSYADTEVFEALLNQTGLDMAVDVAICSQQAQSCKPDAKIFRHALTLAGASPATTMFVGDSIEYDIVGATASACDQPSYQPAR